MRGARRDYHRLDARGRCEGYVAMQLQESVEKKRAEWIHSRAHTIVLLTVSQGLLC